MKTWEIYPLIILFFILSNNFNCQIKKNITDIRQIDFMNFTYSTSITKQFGWNKPVKVKNGEFDDRKSIGEDGFYFGIKVFCGDINHDLIDDAIVIESCGRYSYDWGGTEILVYTIKNGKPNLLSRLSEEKISNDYKSYYPNNVI